MGFNSAFKGLRKNLLNLFRLNVICFI